jgi:hypothetical protein
MSAGCRLFRRLSQSCNTLKKINARAEINVDAELAASIDGVPGFSRGLPNAPGAYGVRSRSRHAIPIVGHIR